jgi:hypothetical protein
VEAGERRSPFVPREIHACLRHSGRSESVDPESISKHHISNHKPISLDSGVNLKLQTNAQQFSIFNSQFEINAP